MNEPILIGIDFANGTSYSVINGQVVPEGVDYHRLQASQFYGIPYKDVTNEQRRLIKERTFALRYSAFNLGE